MGRLQILLTITRGNGAYRARLLTAFAACAFVSAGSSYAQTNAQVNSGIQFDFPLPGARSLALGGAFVAIADDASAAVANPAGLTALAEPEVSAEGRFWRFVSVTPLRGHAFGAPSGIGVDTIAGVVEGETSKNAKGLSFASAVLPLGRFALGVYRHQQSRFRAEIVSEGPFITNPGFEDRLRPFTGTIALDIANYGVALSRRFGNGLSIGGAVALSDFSINSRVVVAYRPPELYTIPANERSRYTGFGQAYGPANLAVSNSEGLIEENGKDKGMAVNVGAIYRSQASRWNVGGAIRLNPKFNYTTASRFGDGHPFFPGVQLNPPQTATFNVPDVYSIGAAWRLQEQWIVSAQFDRVLFSQLSDEFTDVNGTTGGESHTAVIEGLKYPDSNQPRLGTEYVWLRSGQAISFRMGTAYESPHQLTFTQVTPTRQTQLEVLYPKQTKGQWHVTPGLGLAVDSFQIDAAVDLSPRTRTVSVSAVYRF